MLLVFTTIEPIKSTSIRPSSPSPSSSSQCCRLPIHIIRCGHRLSSRNTTMTTNHSPATSFRQYSSAPRYYSNKHTAVHRHKRVGIKNTIVCLNAGDFAADSAKCKQRRRRRLQQLIASKNTIEYTILQPPST